MAGENDRFLPLPLLLLLLLLPLGCLRRGNEPPVALGTGRPLTLSNAALRLTWNPDGSLLQAREGKDKRLFLSCSLGPGPARIVETRHPVFGWGRAMEIRRGPGRTDRIALYGDLPFLFFRPLLKNPGRGAKNLEKVVLLEEASVLPGLPAERLRALGTAGLTKVDGHPGSYTFLALAEPGSRSGVVGAWLTSDRGDGVVFSGVKAGTAWITPRIDYGRWILAPGAEEGGETFLLGWFADARLGLEAFADLVAENYGIHLPPQPDGYCTWYSKPHGRACDEEHLPILAEFCARRLKPFGFRFIQIDDWWQDGKRRNGPAKVFCRHNPKGPYPHGMKPAAGMLSSKGLTPGLWWMPFAADRRDPFFADKGDWLVRRPDGRPYVTAWGGVPLDVTFPPVRDYIASLARRIAREWGYTYFKMDGLWLGTATKQIYINDAYRPDDDLGLPKVHDPSITPIQAYRLGLETIRKAAGPEVFFLGCTVSQNMRTLGASFGLVDAMRIGPDNGPSWKALVRGPWHGSNRYFLHRRVWYNDPDPVYLRPSMPLNHCRLLASWVAISGQLTVFSDWLPDLPPERLDVARRILPNHGRLARPADLFESALPRVWVLRDSRSGPIRTVVGLFNWNPKEKALFHYPLERLGLDPGKTFEAYDFWGRRLLPPQEGELDLEVPAGSCLVLALRPAASHPQVLSTSRHVTQGVVDILEEKWDPRNLTLSGVSRLVAGDPYELRIVLPRKGRPFRLDSITARRNKAKVARVRQEGNLLLVTLEAPKSGETAWSVTFRL